MTGNRAQITYSSEIARKSIHLTSLLIPIIYLQLTHWQGMGILVAMTSTSILFDVLLHYHAPTRRRMINIVGPLLRSHELRQDKFHLTGASWVLIAATASFGIFPTIVGVTAFTVLIVSDTFAALVGRRWGKRSFMDKSLVGTTTFFLTAYIVVVSYAIIFELPWTFYVIGIFASMVGGLAEAASTRLQLDDNISIPFSFGATMWILAVLTKAFGAPTFLSILP